MSVVFAVEGSEFVATGSVLGMLGILMTHFLRRTKDSDELQTEAVKARVEAADHNEQRAWAEVERKDAELQRKDAEIENLRRQLARKDRRHPQ